MIDINSLRERDNTDIFTVSDLNNYIKNLFENNRTLSSVTVRGEISNFVNHRSGHLYFSLKDADGQIRAIMFRSRVAGLKFMPESGMKVIIHGSVNLYPRDGSYQIYVSSMQPDGIGALFLAYEQMKARLAEEGLFDESHKLPIPSIPKRIGVITSPTGAAVRDIINVAGRRFPNAEIFVYPALVQGEGAEASLIKALDYLDRSGLCDVIIIGRGGGSIEDLWAFNGELLARRIYEATTPVISAVGHETDFTICDFVADMRAPTPSAAAEIAVPDRRELAIRLDSFDERLLLALQRKLMRAREKCENLKSLLSGLTPKNIINNKRDIIAMMGEKSKMLIKGYIDKERDRLAVNAGRVDALSPLSILSRGYSITEVNGKIVTNTTDIGVGDKINVILSNGRLSAVVEDIKKEK